MKTLKEKLETALDILNSGDTEFIVTHNGQEVPMPVIYVPLVLGQLFLADPAISIKRAPLMYPQKPQWQLTNHLPGFRALDDGEEWHTTEGWVEADLPAGYRPLLKGEEALVGDQAKMPPASWLNVIKARVPSSVMCRTTRPLPIGTEELAQAMCDEHAQEMSHHQGWVAAAKKAKELLTQQP